MFKKVFEYAGPHKKDLYIATFIVLLSVLMGVLPFVLAYPKLGVMATVLPRTVTDWLARSPVQLSGWVLARRLPARPARNVIRLPMQRSARFQGAYIRLCISRERLLSMR